MGAPFDVFFAQLQARGPLLPPPPKKERRPRRSPKPPPELMEHPYYASNLWRYGISLEDYDAMVDRQENLCAICRGVTEGRPLCVDHCHDTGKVRGLLCVTCNVGLGSFRDRTDLLIAAAKYLRAAKGVPPPTATD